MGSLATKNLGTQLGELKHIGGVERKKGQWEGKQNLQHNMHQTEAYIGISSPMEMVRRLVIHAHEIVLVFLFPKASVLLSAKRATIHCSPLI